MIRKLALGLLAALGLVTGALAQSSPGLTYGQVPTAAEWNSYFSAKTDYPVSSSVITGALGYVPLPGSYAPNTPLIHPGSGNNQCARGHYLWFVDQNLCSTADTWEIVSNDPSALAVFALGGTITSGDVFTMHFLYGGNDVTVTYTVTSGDAAGTLAGLATKLTCAIAANTTLYNSGAGCAGGIVPTTSGGYTGGKPIGYVVIYGNGFAFDHNAAVPMKFSYSVSGAASETITLNAGWYTGVIYPGGTSTGSANVQAVGATGFTLAAGNYTTFVAGFSNSGATTLNVQSTGALAVRKRVNGALVALTTGDLVAGTQYTTVYDGVGYELNINAIHVAGGATPTTQYQVPNALDNNPALVTGRNPGAPAARGSVDFALYTSGNQTGNQPASRTASLGILAHYLGNTSSGALQSSWIFQGPHGGGNYFGEGIYSNEGCSGPFGPDATCIVDKGLGTVNVGTGYWWSGTQDGGGASMVYNSGAVTFNSSHGLGVGAVPSGDTFTSGRGFFVTGDELPTANAAGVTITHNAIISRNWGLSTYTQLNMAGSLLAFQPGGDGNSGLQMLPNVTYPVTDSVHLLGDTVTPHRFASIATKVITLGGATSGDITLASPAVAGTGTLTLPTGTDTLVSRNSTDTLTNKSIVATQLTGTVAAARMPALTGDVTSSVGTVATTIAANAVTNAKLATMADKTFKGNISGGAAVPSDLTAAQVNSILKPAFINQCVTGVNANAVADTAVVLNIPTGVTLYKAGAFEFFNPSLSLTTAQAAVYPSPAAAGIPLLGVTALSPLTNNTPNNSGSLLNVGTTAGNVAYNATTVYLRVTTAQGAASTFDACMTFQAIN